MEIQKTTNFHANTGIIKLNGVAVGRVQNLRANTSSGADYVYEIGSFIPVEINHNRFSARVSVSALELRRGGSPMLNHFPVNLGEIKGCEIEFSDRTTGKKFVAVGCEPTDQSQTTAVNGKVSIETQFMALDIKPGGAGGRANFGGGGGVATVTVGVDATLEATITI